MDAKRMQYVFKRMAIFLCTFYVLFASVNAVGAQLLTRMPIGCPGDPVDVQRIITEIERLFFVYLAYLHRTRWKIESLVYFKIFCSQWTDVRRKECMKYVCK